MSNQIELGINQEQIVDSQREQSLTPEVAESRLLEMLMEKTVRTKTGKFRWNLRGNTPEQDYEMGKNNIRALFVRAHPEFGAFVEICDGEVQIWQEKREEAQKFIVENVGHIKKFNKVFGNGILIPRVSPYFNWSHQLALESSFTSWGLNLDFRVKHNNYWNENTMEQEALKFVELHGCLSHTVLVENDRTDLANQINGYPGGIRGLREKLGVPSHKERLKSIEYEGKSITIRDTIETKSGILWKLPENSSEENTDLGISNVQALFLKKYPEFIQFLEQDERRIHVVEGKKGEAIAYLKSVLGTQDQLIDLCGGTVVQNSYFGNGRRAVQLSFEKWGIKADFIVKQAGYWSAETIRSEVEKFFREHGLLSDRSLREAGRADLAAVIYLYPGGMVSLKKELNIAASQKPKGYWSAEKIEELAREVVDEYGFILTPHLIKVGKGKLVSIFQHYPGGITTLKQKLDLPIVKKLNYWTQDTIEQEARNFYESSGFLSSSTLQIEGRNDLECAISKRYVGGIQALRVKLGISDEKIGLDVQVSSEQANEQLEKLMGGGK